MAKRNAPRGIGLYAAVALAAVLACGTQTPAQMPAAPAVAVNPAAAVPGALGRDLASTLMPATVFFDGQVASVQARNTGGARFASGGLLLSGLVDSSGYSSGVQQRYQAYLLLDTPVTIGGRHLGPGAYGCGVVKGQFLVLDLSAHEILDVPATHDSGMRRPVPLQVLSDGSPGKYRFYLGRDYVRFSAFAPER